MDNEVFLTNQDILVETFSVIQNADCYYKDIVNGTIANEKGFTGKGVTIAVLDTGVDINHRLLKGKIIDYKNFTTEGKSNNVADLNGHGTHVIGEIVGIAEGNFKGGIAPDARVIACKCLDSKGRGGYKNIVNAINYAIEKKVDIISMSLGGRVDDKNLHYAITRAVNLGITVVCASGNDARGDMGLVDELAYPGSYEEVIEVGAFNKQLIPSAFSNSNMMVDLIAPGEAILSLAPGDKFAVLNGTSQATPIVTGALAILKEWSKQEFGRELSEMELYGQLIKCTKKLPDISRRQQGNGRLFLDLF